MSKTENRSNSSKELAKQSYNRKTLFKYSIWVLGFLLFSLALGLFRGSDHGEIPSFATGIPIQGLEEDWDKNLKKAEGKPMVLYFWATWCTVCKANDPFLKASLSAMDDRGIYFLSWEEGGGSQEEVVAYLKEKNITYPVASAGSEILRGFQVTGFPTTIFVDSDRRVRFVDAGIMNPLSFWLRVYLLRFF